MLALVALVPFVAGQGPGKEELKLQLPKPMFIGTPTNIKSANLEVDHRASRAARSSCRSGTKLLSLKRPVKSSDMQPVIGELNMVTDGEKEGGDGYFVELGPGKQWVQIDLGASYALHAILVWHYHSQARVYRDVDRPGVGRQGLPQGRDDGLQQRPRQLGSGSASGRTRSTSRWPRAGSFDPKGAKGRYVRLYSERQHDERPEPLRRSRGLRHAGQMSDGRLRQPGRGGAGARAGVPPGRARRAADAPRRGQPGGQVRRAARDRRLPLRPERSPRPDALLPDAARRPGCAARRRWRRSTSGRSGSCRRSSARD